MTRSKRMLPYALMRTAAVFALSAGVATPALITAPAAYAAESSTTAYPVNARTGDDGRVDLPWVPTNALWVNLKVLESTAPGAAVLAATEELTHYDEVRDFDNESGWRTDAPVHLPVGTPLGEYPIAVSYRLPEGSVQQVSGGAYKHLLRTGVTSLSWDRDQITDEDRKVTLSGAVTTYDPSTRVRTPASAGTQVRLWVASRFKQSIGGEVRAVTDADGRFSIPLTPHATTTAVARVVETGPGIDPDEWFSAPKLPVATFQHRISAQLSSVRVRPGGEIGVTGRVERLTEDGWQPFAGAPVITSLNSPPRTTDKVPNILGGATAAADGSFSYTFKAGTSAHFSATMVTPSPFFATQPVIGRSVHIPKPMKFRDVAIALDPYKQVKASGRVFDATLCPKVGVALQHSTDGKSWRTLRSVRSTDNCTVTATAPRVHNSAYYRLHHAESDHFQELSTPAVRQTRNPTRFTGDQVTPVRPAKNATLTSSGTLQRYVNGKWQSYSGGKITLYFQPRGKTAWQLVTKGTSVSGGKYTLKGQVPGDGNWAVRTDIAAGYFHSETKGTYVDAR
ncbi:hypothetical protein [Streptomyces sp. NPDC020965]|uniref:hypothetical protein n=1 Tax=Streptomyces sp. NPDC020965 TaxID=3365105 RepID=UPI0037A6D2C7